MRLYIPQLGDKLQLSNDWSFDLHSEHRNDSLLKKLLNKSWSEDYVKFRQTGQRVGPTKVSLPKGTVLNVERIYIRKGATNYDSITFKIEDCDSKELIKCRFWVKLKDANFEFEESKTIKRMPSLNWSGWCPDKSSSLIRMPNGSSNYLLELKINDILRFTIKMEETLLEPTDENWNLYNFDKKSLARSNANPRGLYKSFEEYCNGVKQQNYFFMSQKSKSDYKISIIRYILTDVLKDEKYIYFTKNTCKETARKILKEEFKNN